MQQSKMIVVVGDSIRNGFYEPLDKFIHLGYLVYKSAADVLFIRSNVDERQLYKRRLQNFSVAMVRRHIGLMYDEIGSLGCHGSSKSTPLRIFKNLMARAIRQSSSLIKEPGQTKLLAISAAANEAVKSSGKCFRIPSGAIWTIAVDSGSIGWAASVYTSQKPDSAIASFSGLWPSAKWSSRSSPVREAEGAIRALNKIAIMAGSARAAGIVVATDSSTLVAAISARKTNSVMVTENKIDRMMWTRRVDILLTLMSETAIPISWKWLSREEEYIRREDLAAAGGDLWLIGNQIFQREANGYQKKTT
jgi:hypothetical protein